jgi:LPPG:FO 2-phospho-L-lactate transferase
MAELGADVSPRGIAAHFAGLLDGLILDSIDQEEIPKVEALDIRATARRTLMESLSDKVALAETILNWAEETYL